MKYIITLLSFLSLFSCKKVQENVSEPKISNEMVIDKDWAGDALISDLNFVNSVNISCKLNTSFFDRSEQQIKEDNAKCVLSKINFDYEKLDSVNTRTDIGNISDGIRLFIKSSSVTQSDHADLTYRTSLFVEKDKVVTDSIVIYESLNYSEALIVKLKYFYVDKDNIYLLDVWQDESGASAEKWEHHKITTAGKIVLLKQRLFADESNSVATKTDN